MWFDKLTTNGATASGQIEHIIGLTQVTQSPVRSP